MSSPNLAHLLGQPETSAFLRRIVASGRYGNAYLFHGPAGVGKGTAALAFARAALCDRVPGAATFAAPASVELSFLDLPAAPMAAGDDACGECPACRKTATLQHPDLQFLFPVSGPSDESALDKTIGATLQAMRDDPLFVFQYDKAASVRLAQTRELQRELAYRPYEASRRMVVVRDCDRMREDQFSALLKSVEEPGLNVVWVLTTSRLARVPATIRSRCQRVRFAPLGEALVRAFLTAHADVAEPAARTLAALASGSLARALVLRGEDAPAQHRAALELLSPAVSDDPVALWKAVQGATKFGKAGRESLRRMLEYHLLWLRDLLRSRYGAASDALVDQARAAELHRLAERLDAREIRRRLAVVEEALRSIDGNISVDLTLFSTLARVGGARLGEGAWPAHPAGRWDY